MFFLLFHQLSVFLFQTADFFVKIQDVFSEIAQLVEQEEEHTELQDKFTTADLFLRCMHPNGISYDIIKKRLPLINTEVSKILTNIVDFEIFFENEESKLDILIKHPKHEPRPIEMGSGAEKTIAVMAIRLALLNVSTLPKGDIFVLDEPGTSLDAENMEGFIRILDMIKSQFKTVLLISHLDSLKDIVDQEIMIEKNNGRAYVNE
jgi:DNA repair exonuclease SbcCD ATPase subunit